MARIEGIEWVMFPPLPSAPDGFYLLAVKEGVTIARKYGPYMLSAKGQSPFNLYDFKTDQEVMQEDMVYHAGPIEMPDHPTAAHRKAVVAVENAVEGYTGVVVP